MSGGKGKAKDLGGVTIEDDDSDFDVDNMDFGLPRDDGSQPLLMTAEEARLAVASSKSSTTARAASTASTSSSSSSTTAVPPPFPAGLAPAAAAAQPRELILLPDGRQLGVTDEAVRKRLRQSWVSVYPLYFDAGQSRAGGRRVVKARAVASPSIVYLVECCRRLGLAQIVEQGKRHPSDALTFGRIKVQIVRDGLVDPALGLLLGKGAGGGEGQPVRPDVRNKVELLIRLAEVYAETEKAMKLADPTVAAHAAASRSQVSKVQQESLKEAAKEVKMLEEGGGGGGKSGKKSKKKK